MSRQGTSARTLRILLYTLTLLGCLPSHAEEPRPRSGSRTVYRCMHDDVLTLTDQPCQGERIDIDPNRNLTVARPTGSPVSDKVRKTPRKPSTDPTTKLREAQRERCQRLRAQLDTLRSKLRSGYTTAAGIRLEERKRQLREQARSAKCP